MKWTTDHIPSLAGQTAIVTGANSGIGLETARELARKGASVVLACRDVAKAEKACETIRRPEASGEQFSGTAESMQLDLSDLASVRAFAQHFLDSHPSLDILVNNAGVMVPPHTATRDGFELQMGVNHLGHFALTGMLFERLMESDSPRLVVVSSTAHNLGDINLADLNWNARGYHPWKAYGDSKIANLYFMNELHRRYGNGQTRLKAAAAHPGWTATNLQRASCIKNLSLFAMRPQQGALPSLYAATSPDIRGGEFIGPDGCLQLTGYPKVVAPNQRSQRRDTAVQLWEASERLTGVSFMTQ